MKIAMTLFLLLGLWGCAASTPSTRYFDTEDLDRHIADLTSREHNAPRDPEIKRDLGIALQQAGFPLRGLAKLRTARELGAEDPLTLYFYARCADQTDNYEEALANYNAYLKATGKRDGVVLARMETMAKAKARRELSRAVRAESSINTGDLDASTVAVPAYANLGHDPDLAPLGRGLALVLLTDLSRVSSLRVVEREKLSVLQDEMELSGKPVAPLTDSWAPIGTTVGIKQRLAYLRSPRGFPYYSGSLDDSRSQNYVDAVVAFQKDFALAPDGVPGPQTQRAIEKALGAADTTTEIDEDSLVRVGKLLSAGTVVLGAYTPAGEGELQLHADVAALSGGLVSTDAHRGRIPTVLRLQKQLTFDILDALGIAVDDALRLAIEPLPTEDFRAFLAFCRGLDWNARGVPEEAVKAFREALERDSGFTLAREALDMAGAGDEETREYSRLLLGRTLTPQGDSLGQLYRTGGWIGMGPGVVLDRGDDEDGVEVPTGKVEPARVVVEGELPGGQP